MNKELNKCVLGAALLAVMLSGTAAVNAQAKWWWEKYPAANDKTLQLKNATGGSIESRNNPTGANSSIAGNSATQPPTVIIQQTASATPSGTGMTCTQSAFGMGYNPNNGYFGYYYATSCPNIPGYVATPITATASAVSQHNNVVASCCYVKNSDAGVPSGGGIYDPWLINGTVGGGAGIASFKTAGAQSWTVPPGVYKVWVSFVGGGGGGGAGAGAGQPGGGGGSGGMTYRYAVMVHPADIITFVVGAGGAGGTNGSPGGITSIQIPGQGLSGGGGGGGSAYGTTGACNTHSTGGYTGGGWGGASGCNNVNGEPGWTGFGTVGAVSGGYYMHGRYTYVYNGSFYNRDAGAIGTPTPAPLPPSTATGNSQGGSSAYGTGLSNGGPGFTGLRGDPSTGTSKGMDGAGASSAGSGIGQGGKGYGAGGGGGVSGPGGKGADGAVWFEW